MLPLLCGGSGNAVLFRAVLAAPSQHSLELGPSRTWMHNRLVQAQLKQWCVFRRKPRVALTPCLCVENLGTHQG